MVKQLNSVEAFREFIHQYPLAVVHVMRDQCSVVMPFYHKLKT